MRATAVGVAALAVAAGLAACRERSERDRGAAGVSAVPQYERRPQGTLKRQRVLATVERIEGDGLVLRLGDGSPLTLRLDPQTRVAWEGKTARAEALPAGAKVEAWYQEDPGARPTAIAISVLPGAPAPGGHPSAGAASGGTGAGGGDSSSSAPPARAMRGAITGAGSQNADDAQAAARGELGSASPPSQAAHGGAGAGGQASGEASTGSGAQSGGAASGGPTQGGVSRSVAPATPPSTAGRDATGKQLGRKRPSGNAVRGGTEYGGEDRPQTTEETGSR